MLDRRAPNICRIEDIPGLTDLECRSLRKFADRVYARTDAQCVFNCKTGRLFFYLRDLTQGFALPKSICSFRTFDGNFDWAVEDRLDDLCLLIQEGRMDRKQKDLIEQYNAAAVKSQALARFNAAYDDIERGVKDHAKNITARRGMHSRYRRAVLVNGTRGVA